MKSEIISVVVVVVLVPARVLRVCPDLPPPPNPFILPLCRRNWRRAIAGRFSRASCRGRAKQYAGMRMQSLAVGVCCGTKKKIERHLRSNPRGAQTPEVLKTSPLDLSGTLAVYEVSFGSCRTRRQALDGRRCSLSQPRAPAESCTRWHGLDAAGDENDDADRRSTPTCARVCAHTRTCCSSGIRTCKKGKIDVE